MTLMSQLIHVLAGTGFTFFMTALGAAMIFFFKDDLKPETQKLFLGFAAGVMVAASVWSLLIPAMNAAESQGIFVMLPVGGGFILGVLFLLLLDRLIPHLHPVENEIEGLHSNFKRTTMLVLAVTLHNIPEGMAVGIAFVMAAKSPETAPLAGAVALALGMGLQNFPEGAAISLPLRKEGMSKRKSFLYGAASGIVEPIGGVITVFLATLVSGLLPWILSFAAGAMIYVVVEELIPESRMSEHSHAGTLSFIVGFLIMMSLDVILG